jgi:hypothetical protein
MVGQSYGNTTGAYNFGQYWYLAGQGLHFGIDFPAPCQTPVVAVADGVIEFADNFSHGSLPHNLSIRHRELGLISFYGHLWRRPGIQRGQVVKKGEVVALSGDPDSTCISRPHLHLEIRSLDYTIAYNPAALIDADWSMLMSIGAYQGRFAKDLYYPNRWQTATDQPAIKMGGNQLNRYRAVWPPRSRYAASPQTANAFSAPPLADSVRFKRLTAPGCCSLAWWNPKGDAVRFFNNAVDNQFADTYEADIVNGTVTKIEWLSPSSQSLNGAYKLRWQADRAETVRVSDGRAFQIGTSGTWPTFSPNATQLLWQRFPADAVPGNAPPKTEVWVSKVNGDDRRVLTIQTGGSVYWLDEDRVLLAAREGETLFTSMSIYQLSTKTITPLYRAENIRGLSVAPGGKHISFYLTFQKQQPDNAVYLLETVKGATPVKMPFFGAWRWRGSGELLYIPFKLGDPMRLMHYELATGKITALTDPAVQPFSILNDDWSVAPDGQNVVYWDSSDQALWVIQLSARSSS